MNVSYGGNVNLASSNFLDPTQPFAFNNMITGGVTTYGAGTVFIVNSQASTYSSTYIGVTGSPTTVSISIKDPSLSITNAGNLQGVTMASISNSMEIFPIHTLEGWNPNPSSPGWSYDQFYNSNLQNDPTLNLTHYQFTEFAVYRTQLDQNGNTVTNQDDAGALSYVADGPTTIQQDVYSGYNAGRTINVTFTLIPGYVYQLDSLMNAMVIFGSEDLTQPGSGTYLDPTTSLQVSFQSTSVPEPTSLALLSLGGIGLMAVRLRMRRLPA